MRPKVGVGVLVWNGTLLLGSRKGAHGAGTWQPPGGHLEFGETPIQCAKRELAEETGLEAKEVIVGPWTNDLFEKEQKHYITLFMIVTEFEGEPSVLEPEKCGEWRWCDLEALPQPLFLPLQNLRQQTSLDQLFHHEQNIYSKPRDFRSSRSS